MKKLIIAFLVLLSMAIAVQAQDQPFFLTVDMGELYSKYDKAIESQEKFTEAAKKAQGKINTMIQAGIKLGEQYQDLQAKASNPALTESARQRHLQEANEKAKEIEQKQIDINQYQQQTTQTLSQRRQSVINLHMAKIKGVLSKIAKTRGADLVLNSTGVVVMYHNKKTDVTTEALSALNASGRNSAANPRPSSSGAN